MRKIATRNLVIEMFLDEKQQLHAHGQLLDDRFISFHAFEGGSTAPGCFHDLGVKMIIDIRSFEILEIEVCFLKAPDTACPEVTAVYQQLKGIRIASGYSRKVLALAGGPKGCAHLTHLIITMGPAIVQGAFTALAEEHSGTAGDSSFSDAHMENYFYNSCHVWKEKTPG